MSRLAAIVILSVVLGVMASTALTNCQNTIIERNKLIEQYSEVKP